MKMTSYFHRQNFIQTKIVVVTPPSGEMSSSDTLSTKEDDYPRLFSVDTSGFRHMGTVYLLI